MAVIVAMTILRILSCEKKKMKENLDYPVKQNMWNLPIKKGHYKYNRK